MQLLLISLIYIVFSTSVQAQVVRNTSWNSIEEFKAEEPNIVKNIIWLENNPTGTNQNDTKGLSENIISWLSNTPYLTVVLDGFFLENLMNNKRFKYAEKFKVTYLFGKSLYIIEHQDDWDEVQASLRGIEGMIMVYKELKKLDSSLKNSTLEKYSKMRNNGKLESYVKQRLLEPAKPLSY